jgi:hypothetical protein
MIRHLRVLLAWAATFPLPLSGQQGTSTAGLAPPASVSLVQLEVEQGIQDERGSVPVLAGRTTLVRAYLHPSTAQPFQLKGTLQATNRSTGATSRYGSTNAVSLTALPATLAELRANPAHTLNFLIPAADLREGDIQLDLAETSSPTGEQVACANCQQFPVVVKVTRAPPLLLVLVGLRFVNPANGNPLAPRPQDFDALESWLRRAYPAELRVSRRVVDVADRPGFPCDTANARLAAIRASDMRAGADSRTHYYGLVYDGGAQSPFFMRGCAAGIPAWPDPSVVASGPAGAAAFPWDKDGSYADWYGGHELAHTLGRMHIGECGQDKSDTLYPYANGQLSSTPATFQGWDPGDPAVAPGTLMAGEQWHDVMSYCDYQWISDHTYIAIRDRLASEDALAAGVVPGAAGAAPAPAAAGPQPAASEQPGYVSVIAVVNLTHQTGTIQEIAPTAPTMGARPPVGGRASIRVLDASGAVLGTYTAWLRESTDILPGRDSTASVHEVIPFSTAMRRVELLLDGRVLDARQAGGSSPTLLVVDKPAAGPQPPGAPVTFTWRARDTDNDRLTYTVRIRFEGSTTWETFATGLTARQITLDRDQLMGRRVSQLEVVASDGLRVDEVRVVSP